MAVAVGNTDVLASAEFSMKSSTKDETPDIFLVIRSDRSPLNLSLNL